MPRPFHNRIHQVAALSNQPQGLLQVRFFRIPLDGFFEYVDPPLQIALRLGAPRHLGDKRGLVLPLLFLGLQLQRLKHRVARTPLQKLVAELQGLDEIPVGQVSLPFRIGAARCVPLRADLVVETLVLRVAVGNRGIRRAPRHLQNALQFRQRGTDLASLVAVHCRLVELLGFRSRPCHLLFPPVHVRQKSPGPGVMRIQFENFLQALPCLPERTVMNMLIHQSKPVLGLTLAPLLLDSASQAHRVRVLRIDFEYLLDLLHRQRELVLFQSRARALQ